MSEYRQDPLTGCWVVIAEERVNRPFQFDLGTNVNGETISLCPFCPGNEKETPPEIMAIRPSGSNKDDSRWLARVVPNKYPAVRQDLPWNPDRFPYPDEIPDRFDTMYPGYGQHEVLIESPRHILSIAGFDDHEILNTFELYRQRLLSLAEEQRWAHVLIFKNVGSDAGASLPHTHSQLMALPFVPPPIFKEMQHAEEFFQKHDSCYWCEMIHREREFAKRVVTESDHFVMLCPFVSRFPMEIAIYPKDHYSHFETITEEMNRELAFFTRKAVQILERSLVWFCSPLSYNLILKSAPLKTGQVDLNRYHFYLSLFPSLAKAAGFEWGTGLHINPISPETAAAKLRDYV